MGDPGSKIILTIMTRITF